MKADQATALIRKTRRIHGWFSPEAAMLFAWIDEIQKSNGLVGDVFEIGVHHGKTAAFLGAMLDPAREKLAVCDLFGEQSRNVSGSGSGNRHVFERNLELYLARSVEVRVFAKSSTELTQEETGRNYRFIHIDGGHSANEALSDLRFAAGATLEEGVIAVDDPMTPEWPGVAEAIFHFLSSEKRFCAMVAGFNKMLLVRRDCAASYTRHIDREEGRAEYGMTYPWHFKQLPFMNDPLRIFFIPSFVDRTSIGTKWIRYYQTHRWPKHPLLGPVVSLGKLLLGRNKR